MDESAAPRKAVFHPEAEEFKIYFAVEPDRLRIVAVAHQKRRPGYWTDRLTR